MKNLKTIASIIALFLLFAPAASFAQSGSSGPKGIYEPGTGLEEPELREAVRETIQAIEISENLMKDWNN